MELLKPIALIQADVMPATLATMLLNFESIFLLPTILRESEEKDDYHSS